MKDDAKILSNLVKNMAASSNDPLKPLIEEYLIKRDSSPYRLRKYVIDMVPRHRPPGRLSPSTVCKCQRQAVFKFIGVKGKRRLDPDLELIFDDGNWRHHKWQATFKDMQEVLGADRFEVVAIEEQVSSPDDYVEGWLDVILRIDGILYVIDIKGINNSGFNRLYAEGKPDEHHELQLVTYCHHSGIRRGWLVYENKDNQSLMVYPVKAKMRIVSQIQKWCKSVVGYMERRELPPIDEGCSVGNRMFDSCPWNHICYGGMSDEQIAHKVYRKFKSVESSWLKGQQEKTDHQN